VADDLGSVSIDPPNLAKWALLCFSFRLNFRGDPTFPERSRRDVTPENLV